MKIGKIKLKNFRCFGSEETVIHLDDLSAIIGANTQGRWQYWACLRISIQHFITTLRRLRSLLHPQTYVWGFT